VIKARGKSALHESRSGVHALSQTVGRLSWWAKSQRKLNRQIQKRSRGLAAFCILEFGILSVIPVLEPAADSLFIRVHLCDPLVKLISDCASPGRLLSFGLDRCAGFFQNSGELRSESGRRPLLPMGFFFSFRPAIAGVIHWEKEERLKLCISSLHSKRQLSA